MIEFGSVFIRTQLSFRLRHMACRSSDDATTRSLFSIRSCSMLSAFAVFVEKPA